MFSENKPIAVIIMAAGKGTRFKSDLAKVLHPIMGVPMVRYPVNLARRFNPEKIVVVVGHQADAVKNTCGPDVEFAFQTEQNGTGHAVMCAEGALAGFSGNILIMSGDVPALTVDTITELIKTHQHKEAMVSFVSAFADDSKGYGRVISTPNGYKIIEHKDASEEQLMIKEINVGLYLADSDFLFTSLKSLNPNNAQSEYYLPQIVDYAADKGLITNRFIIDNLEEALGVNDRFQLAETERRMRLIRLQEIALTGVTIQDPWTTYIDYNVKIGKGSFIGAGCHLLGETVIGENVTIEPNSYLKNVRVNDGHYFPFETKILKDFKEIQK